MVAGLLDTSVIIDLLRKYLPAEQWLLQQADIGISVFVWMEVIQGTRSKFDQAFALKTLGKYPMIQSMPDDVDWALNQLTRLQLRVQVEAFDCLIASASHRLQVPLYTINLKQYDANPGFTCGATLHLRGIYECS